MNSNMKMALLIIAFGVCLSMDVFAEDDSTGRVDKTSPKLYEKKVSPILDSAAAADGVCKANGFKSQACNTALKSVLNLCGSTQNQTANETQKCSNAKVSMQDFHFVM